VTTNSPTLHGSRLASVVLGAMFWMGVLVGVFGVVGLCIGVVATSGEMGALAGGFMARAGLLTMTLGGALLAVAAARRSVMGAAHVLVYVLLGACALLFAAGVALFALASSLRQGDVGTVLRASYQALAIPMILVGGLSVALGAPLLRRKPRTLAWIPRGAPTEPPRERSQSPYRADENVRRRPVPGPFLEESWSPDRVVLVAAWSGMSVACRLSLSMSVLAAVLATMVDVFALLEPHWTGPPPLFGLGIALSMMAATLMAARRGSQATTTVTRDFVTLDYSPRRLFKRRLSVPLRHVVAFAQGPGGVVVELRTRAFGWDVEDHARGPKVPEMLVGRLNLALSHVRAAALTSDGAGSPRNAPTVPGGGGSPR
jgi:hypothetical protein